MSVHRFALSELVPLEDAIAQTWCTGAQKECTGLLGQAISSLLKQLKEAAEGGFAVGVRDGEIRNSFSMIASYCCDIRETKNESAVWHGAGRLQPCARCRTTYEHRVRGRKSSSCVVAKTTDTERKVGKKQTEAASLSGRGHSIRRRKV